MAYPQWVLKYKKPGMYVQKKDDHTYRIYRGHSERRPGKSYPVLITDEYIGTITKEKGLVYSQPKVKGVVTVKRFGGFSLLSGICRALADQLKSKYGGETLFLDACQQVLYGESSNVLYTADWMSEYAPGLHFPVGSEQKRETIRIARGMETTLEKRFGREKSAVLEAVQCIYRVKVNRRWVTSDESSAVWVREAYGVTWEGGFHGKAR